MYNNFCTLLGLGSPLQMGLNVLRLGGSMSNARGYRWKNFRGPRWLRPTYKGTWYGYASGAEQEKSNLGVITQGALTRVRGGGACCIQNIAEVLRTVDPAVSSERNLES